MTGVLLTFAQIQWSINRAKTGCHCKDSLNPTCALLHCVGTDDSTKAYSFEMDVKIYLTVKKHSRTAELQNAEVK